MITTQRMRGRRALVPAAVGTALAVAVSLGACSSGGGGDTGSTTKASSDTSNSKLAAEVAKLSKPLDAYPVPTEPVKNVSSAAGGTLFYIPITQQAPEFTVTQSGVEAAAKAVGMKVQVCDGKGTPTAISACLSHATEAKAAGIILDAIPYGMAANGIGAAQAAGIPVVIYNQLPDSKHPDTKTLVTLGSSGMAQQLALAKWISLDSKGKATVLINESTDGASQVQYVKTAISKVYDTDCSGCDIAINEVSSANFPQIPSSTSAALLKNPNVTYVLAEFAQFLQATEKGIQNAGKTGKVSVVTGAATLNALKALKSDSHLKAAVAQASAYIGWVEVDAVLRLIAGQQVPEYTFPVRLFTKDNIGSVTLTDKAEMSGEWFGPTTFPATFAKTWGVS